MKKLNMEDYIFCGIETAHVLFDAYPETKDSEHEPGHAAYCEITKIDPLIIDFDYAESIINERLRSNYYDI